jgi:transcription elongation factor GreA
MRSYPMTPAGYRKLKEELHNLKFVQVVQNIKDIEEARAHGDLKENAEYHAAKDKQSHLAARVNYVQDRIALAEVVEIKRLSSDRVMFGATVTLENVDTEEEFIYKIVGEDETDPSNGVIAITSPLAKCMIGKSVDDEFVLKTSVLSKEYAIIKIEYKQ